MGGSIEVINGILYNRFIDIQDEKMSYKNSDICNKNYYCGQASTLLDQPLHCCIQSQHPHHPSSSLCGGLGVTLNPSLAGSTI